MPKVIVSCAVTGAVHVPAMTPHLPFRSEDIASSAIEAAEAGATILHLHARDPETGKPSCDPEVFAKFLPQIAAGTDAIINITTGGGLGMPLEERTAAARHFKPELCSLNMGSMNFGVFPIAQSITEYQHSWEPEYLEKTRDLIFKNTFLDIEEIVKALGETGMRFEFECYDVGHLYTLAHFLDRGMLKPPLFIQMVLGILGGIGPDAANLMHMRSVADRLFGDSYLFSTLGAGRHQMRLATMSAILGGNVRVGLEDSIYLERGRLAQSNAEQVTKIRRLLAELSLEVATPTEARELLGLKGAEQTGMS